MLHVLLNFKINCTISLVGNGKRQLGHFLVWGPTHGMTSCKSRHPCKWGRSFVGLSTQHQHHQRIWCSLGRCTFRVLCDKQHHLNRSHRYHRKGKTSCSDPQHCTDHWASWRRWGKDCRISWCDSLALFGWQGWGRGSSRHRDIRRSVWHSLQDSRMDYHRPKLNLQVSYR